MEAINELVDVVRREVEAYNLPGLNTTGYFVANEAEQIYAILDVPPAPQPFPTAVALMARVVGDTVIIEADMHDRPLVGELVRLGIPRGKIFLTYAGEQPPQVADAAQSRD